MKLPAMKPGAAVAGDAYAHNSTQAIASPDRHSSVLESTINNSVLRAWPILLDRCHRRIGIDVASSRAIAQLADHILGVWVFRFLVRA